MGGIRNLVGDEVVPCTQLLADAGGRVVERMCEHAQRPGADPIVAVRFTTSTAVDGAAELYGYGPAVRLEPTRNRENTTKL